MFLETQRPLSKVCVRCLARESYILSDVYPPTYCQYTICLINSFVIKHLAETQSFKTESHSMFLFNSEILQLFVQIFFIFT